MPKPSLITNREIPFVRVEGLAATVAQNPVLTDVSFEIGRGEIAAVIGPNGSGKTTLLRAMLGLIPTTAGTCTIEGKPVSQMRTRIGYLPQRFQFDQDFPLTVREFLTLSFPKNARHVRAKLKEVGLEENVLHQRLGTLSGGQLQRVLIAQATLHHPSLLILDEPSTGVDIVGEKQFYDLIRAQRDTHGTTVILVSHDISVIADVVDQIVCINKRLVCFGPPAHALTKETISKLYGGANASIYHHHRHDV